MQVSVVIPTYNEVRTKDLFDMLSSLQEQECTDFEVIIVVERSENLASLLKEYLGRTRMAHQVVFSPGLRGISYARNLGVRLAKGEIVAFTDDDAMLPPGFMSSLLAAYARHPEAIGVTGDAYPLWIDKAQSWFPIGLYWMVGCTSWRGWSEERVTKVSSGVNMSFRKEAFSLVTFQEDIGAGASSRGKLGLPNEDNQFSLSLTRRTNRPLIFDPKVHVFHKVHPFRLKPRYLRRYAFWQGCAEASYTRQRYSRGKDARLRLQVLSGLIASLVRSQPVGGGKPTLVWREVKTILPIFIFFLLGYFAFVTGTRSPMSKLI